MNNIFNELFSEFNKQLDEFNGMLKLVAEPINKTKNELGKMGNEINKAIQETNEYENSDIHKDILVELGKKQLVVPWHVGKLVEVEDKEKFILDEMNDRLDYTLGDMGDIINESEYPEFIKELYKEFLYLFNNEYYSLASCGLLVIIDKTLEIYNKKETNIPNRVAKKIKKINSELYDSVSWVNLIETIKKASEVLSTKIEFNLSEPDNVNRHWILHGRREKAVIKEECIKLIHILFGIMLIKLFFDKEV